MIKVLWLSPNFNHYKARCLNHLASDKKIKLTVLSGSGRNQVGDKEINGNWKFEYIRVEVPKMKFGRSNLIRKYLKSMIQDFDWVMLPAEKKNLPLFWLIKKLKEKHPNVRFFSYNHPIFKSGKGKITMLDKILTKWVFKKLDRVIFYTEQSYEWALKKKLVPKIKAYWANNTIDDIEIKKQYTFVQPPPEPRILFIGRLIKSKRIYDLLTYYQELKINLPSLKLEIIGDGPQKNIIEAILRQTNSIIWHGAIVDEKKIAPIMQRTSLVFIPGHSGLSINHAFTYGRPYITIEGASHAPELDYIDNDKNGFILPDDKNTIITNITELINNRKKLEQFCCHAKEKGKELSIQNWVAQIKYSLLHE